MAPLLRLLRGGSLAALLPLVGCMSYYDGGPAFRAPTPRSDGALVVVYRPQKALGALQTIHAQHELHDCSLAAGAYCTFFLPPGRHRLVVSIPVWSQAMATSIGGVSKAWTTTELGDEAVAVDVTVEAGKTYYVRTAFNGFKKPPSADAVPAEGGADEANGLHLAPGGRARRPDPVAPKE